MMICNNPLLDGLGVVARQAAQQAIYQVVIMDAGNIDGNIEGNDADPIDGDNAQLKALFIRFNEYTYDKGGNYRVSAPDFISVLSENFKFSDFDELIELFIDTVGGGAMPVCRMMFGDPALPGVQPPVGYGAGQISPIDFLDFFRDDPEDGDERANRFHDLVCWFFNFVGLGPNQIPLQTYINKVNESPEKSDLLISLYYPPAGDGCMAEYFRNQHNVPGRLTLREAILLDVALLECIANVIRAEDMADYHEKLETLVDTYLEDFMNDPEFADFINHRTLAEVIRDPALYDFIGFTPQWKQIFTCTTHYYTSLLAHEPAAAAAPAGAFAFAPPAHQDSDNDADADADADVEMG